MYSALHPLQNSTYITFLALHVSCDFTTKGFWRFLKVTVGFSMIKSHTPHRAFLHLKTPLFSVSRSSNLAPVNICFKFGGCLKPLIIFLFTNAGLISLSRFRLSIACRMFCVRVGWWGLYVCTKTMLSFFVSFRV